MNESINQSINQSINESTNQSIHPSIHQSINQASKQSINQWMKDAWIVRQQPELHRLLITRMKIAEDLLHRALVWAI